MNTMRRDADPAPIRRARCLRCARPCTACICLWIRPLESPVELLILQHPMEQDNAKGSARLLQLSVAGSRLLVGEQFDAGELTQLLHAGGRRPVLLYPAAGGVDAAALPAAAAPAAQRLVVIDGTWRKSRKMLHLNAPLRELARLALSDVAPSRYRIRKAHAPDQLSTLEAACQGLALLDGDPARYLALLDGFDGFVDQLALRTGR